MSTGYSGTPLARKLGIRQGDVICLVDAPADLPEKLAPLPSGARLERWDGRPTTGKGADGRGSDRFDVVLLFCPDGDALRRRFRHAVSRLRWTGGLWACWPKKSSPLHVDLAREEVREVGLETGLVDNKVCAVDEDWSGLRFVVRVEDRPRSVEDGGPGG